MNNSALDLVRNTLIESSADAILLSYLPHVRKVCGFSGSNGALVITSDAAVLLTDGRYTEQAADEASNVAIRIISGSLTEAIVDYLKTTTPGRLLIQGAYFSATDYFLLDASLGSDRIVLTKDMIEPLLSPKSGVEVDRIQAAQDITDEVFSVLPGMIKAGMSEKDLAAIITNGHLVAGADKMSFDPIVAFGESSSRPHARPGSRKLQKNDPILVDVGCVLDGYCSDMTRMMIVGEPSERVTEIISIVAKAKSAAIDFAGPGVVCSDLDGIARTCIASAGYGDKFVHSLGHGVGLEIHEWPSVSTRSNYRLQVGDVITLEPGIYLPGEFGVRLEDMVVITEDGCSVLTNSPTSLVTV